MKQLNPNDGHIFEITHRSCGAYSIAGEDGHFFEPDFTGEPITFKVQGWSLKEALLKAADLPFNILMGEEEDNETTQEHGAVPEG